MRSLTKIVLILLAVSMFAQAAMKTAIVVYFYANKTYIAQNLCENRSKPKSCCLGKCQLRKWIKQADQPVPGAPAPNLKSIEELQLFCEDLPMPFFPIRPMLQRADFPPFLTTAPTACNRSFFHPPNV